MVGSRPGQGGTRGASSGLKYGPIAALFKAVTRGILPAYLTMAALSTPGPQDDVAWLRYWVAVAAVSLLELFLPSRLSRLGPLLHTWCLLPGSVGGTRILFALVYRGHQLHQERSAMLGTWFYQVLGEKAIAIERIWAFAADTIQPILFILFFIVQSLQGLISIALSLDPLPILLLVSATVFVVWYTGEEKKKVARLRKRSMVPAASAENTAGGEEAAGALVLQENENEAFTRQMAAKSRKIVMDAEHGEAKGAIDRCKKFLNNVETSQFACKIFINSWEDIEGVKNFERIVNNVGAQLKLPKEDIEGLKLCATGGRSKRDYLAFDCAMKEEGQVRLHTGGYSVSRKEGELLDFQILHHSIDMAHVTLKQLPGEAERQLVGANWLRGQSGAGHQPPSEGRDWNVYFQYEAHKNLLKELPDDEEDFT